MKLRLAILAIAVAVVVVVVTQVAGRASSSESQATAVRASGVTLGVGAGRAALTTGRVIDQAGAPIGAALVVLASDRSRPVYAITGRDGSWATALADGRYTLAVSAPGFLPSARKVTLADSLDTVLERGGVTLRGAVEDISGGPIAGARIRFVDADTDAVIAATLVDDSGHYAASLPAAQLVATAEADGYATAQRRFDLRPRVAPSGDFELVIGGAIRGSVVGPDGQPCRDAKVFAEVGSDYHRQRLDVTANEAGEFALEGLQGGDVSLHAVGPGCTTRDAKVVALAVGGALEGVTITALRGFTLTGTVLDKESRAPIANVSIRVDREQMWTIRGGEVTSDAAGRFTVHGIEPGTYELDVTPEKHLVDLIEVSITGDTTRDIELTRGRTITGRVEPPMVAKLALDLNEYHATDLTARRKQAIGATSKPDGTFVLEGVLDGAFVIGARSEDGTFHGKAKLDETARELTIAMSAFGDATVSGVVVEESGAPVVGLEIGVFWPNDSFGEHRKQFTAADGSFRFERLPRREVSFWLEGRIATKPEVLIRTPGDRDEMRIVVRSEAAAIRGRVVDPDGKPATDVAITGMPRFEEGQSGGMLVPKAVSDASGAFVLANLREGNYVIRATTPAGDGQAMITARSGETVTIKLERSARILMHVTRNGKPVEAYRLGCRFDKPVPHLDMGMMSSFSTSTNGRSDGTYRSDETFPLGRARCHVEADEGGANVTVEMGRVAEVVIEPWAKVRALIVDGAGKPRAVRAIYRHADVKPSPNADEDLARAAYREYAEVSENGRLELNEVFPGPGWVAIYTADFSKLLASRRIVPAVGEQIELGTIAVD